MATVMADGATATLEFTALEINLLREIAFNTGKNLDQLVAERLQQGIEVAVPGKDQDYELRYKLADRGEAGQSSELIVKLDAGYAEDDSNDDYAAEKHDLRFNLNLRLHEFYNIAWTHGVSAAPDVLNTDLRKNHVDAYVNLILHKILKVCENAKQ